MPERDSIPTASETRVIGLFEDCEQAQEAVEELKDAGFADDLIAVAMHDSAAQDSFLAETHVQSAEDLSTLPELDSGQILVMVEADDRAELALEIINRNHGIPGGARTSAL